MTADRSPVILSLIAVFLPDEPHLQAAAATCSIEAADLWPPTGIDEAAARWCADILAGNAAPTDRTGPDARLATARVARRLAEVACALSIREDDPAAADTFRDLWRAASRLLGVQSEQATPTFHTNRGPMTVEQAAAAINADEMMPGARVVASPTNPERPKSATANPKPDPQTFPVDAAELAAWWKWSDTIVAEKAATAAQRRLQIDDALAGMNETIRTLDHNVGALRRERDDARAEADHLRNCLRREEKDSYNARLADAMADAMRLQDEVDHLRAENATLREQVERVTADAARKVEEAKGGKAKHGDPVRVRVRVASSDGLDFAATASYLGAYGTVLSTYDGACRVRVDDGHVVSLPKSCLEFLR